ncbi:ddhd domain-containing protein [Cyclospora cayetanensis]|uniref:Ddhd domain-containing protein n=1 Tax=Cyclospora cayetanensis TaxID=88456 RepID=A0A1D3D2V3_9EIME|nr:ddhd domain-containing protein [Cyclospora cayetanensis]
MWDSLLRGISSGNFLEEPSAASAAQPVGDLAAGDVQQRALQRLRDALRQSRPQSSLYGSSASASVVQIEEAVGLEEAKLQNAEALRHESFEVTSEAVPQLLFPHFQAALPQSAASVPARLLAGQPTSESSSLDEWYEEAATQQQKASFDGSEGGADPTGGASPEEASSGSAKGGGMDPLLAPSATRQKGASGSRRSSSSSSFDFEADEGEIVAAAAAAVSLGEDLQMEGINRLTELLPLRPETFNGLSGQSRPSPSDLLCAVQGTAVSETAAAATASADAGEEPADSFLLGEADKCAPVEHVLLVVHGIGCGSQHEVCQQEQLRHSIRCVNSLWYWRKPVSVHVLAINWKRCIVEAQDHLFQSIGISSMYEMRRLLTLTAGDLLFFMTPRFGDFIMQQVAAQLNAAYHRLKHTQHKSTSEVPKLDFNAECLFLLGGCLPAFLLLNSPEILKTGLQLPPNLRVYNLFHPCDPVVRHVKSSGLMRLLERQRRKGGGWRGERGSNAAICEAVRTLRLQAFRLEKLVYPNIKEVAPPVLIAYWRTNGLQGWYKWDLNVQQAKDMVTSNLNNLTASVMSWWRRDSPPNARGSVLVANEEAASAAADRQLQETPQSQEQDAQQDVRERISSSPTSPQLRSDFRRNADHSRELKEFKSSKALLHPRRLFTLCIATSAACLCPLLLPLPLFAELSSVKLSLSLPCSGFALHVLSVALLPALYELSVVALGLQRSNSQQRAYPFQTNCETRSLSSSSKLSGSGSLDSSSGSNVSADEDDAFSHVASWFRLGSKLHREDFSAAAAASETAAAERQAADAPETGRRLSSGCARQLRRLTLQDRISRRPRVQTHQETQPGAAATEAAKATLGGGRLRGSKAERQGRRRSTCHEYFSTEDGGVTVPSVSGETQRAVLQLEAINAMKPEQYIPTRLDYQLQVR